MIAVMSADSFTTNMSMEQGRLAKFTSRSVRPVDEIEQKLVMFGQMPKSNLHGRQTLLNEIFVLAMGMLGPLDLKPPGKLKSKDVTRRNTLRTLATQCSQRVGQEVGKIAAYGAKLHEAPAGGRVGVDVKGHNKFERAMKPGAQVAGGEAYMTFSGEISGFENYNEAERAYALRQHLKEIGSAGIEAHGLRIQHYLSDAERAGSIITFNLGQLYLNGVPMNTPGTNGEPVDQAMYAMDVNGTLYAKCYDRQSAIQINHSSFTGGKNVLCAGTMRVEQGQLIDLTPASGHYMPTRHDLLECMRQMKTNGYRPDRRSHVTTFWEPAVYGAAPNIPEGPPQVRVPWLRFSLVGGGMRPAMALTFAGTWDHDGRFKYVNLDAARAAGCSGPMK